MNLTRTLVDVPTYLWSRWQSSRGLQAAAWGTSLFILGQVLRFAANLIVTRLLAPEMFGVMSIVLIIQFVLFMLCDVGLLPIVMRSSHGDDETFLNTVWSVQILRGIAIWVFGLLVAVALVLATRANFIPANSVWHAPELPAVMAVSIFGAVIGGFQSTKLYSAYRHMDARKVALIEFATQITNLATIIVVAFATRSVWAFVAGSLVSALAATGLSHVWLPGKRNQWAWNRDALDEIYASGGWMLLASLVFIAAVNADRLLLAGYTDTKTLGLYAIAFSLLTMVDVLGQRLVGFVFQPALNIAVRNSPEAVRATLLRQRKFFDAGFLFIAGSLFAAAQSLIALMYDPRYALAGHILQILSILFVFSRYTSMMGPAYIAIGRPELTVIVNTVRLVSILILLPLGYRIAGFEGALLGVAIHQLPSVAVIFWLNRKFDFNDFRLELMLLPVWFAGFGCGRIVSLLLSFIHR